MSRRVHIVGIAGTGMSAIAKLLQERGDTVTGSDLAASPFLAPIQASGARVWLGHAAEHVRGADLVVASSAVSDDNVELAEARRLGIPVLRRAAFLGELTAGRVTVAVAGTHGKTTTTALVSYLLRRLGADPSYLIGGSQEDLGGNAAAGGGRHFVIEADEYDRTFLGLRPSLAVITNVEHDHPDCFPTAADFHAAFEEFADLVEDALIVCKDDPGADRLQPRRAKRWTYGLSPVADWRAEELRANPVGGMDFVAVRGTDALGPVRTRLAGEHNVRNTLAALAAVEALGLPVDGARRALADFHGVARRFEVVGETGGVTVIDDYAHHPTEIRATLAAARLRYPQSAVWAVFQPHTYSRTREFLGDLARSFAEADHVLVTEVYPSRERPDPSFRGSEVVERIVHPDARYLPSLEAAASDLLARVRPGSVVVTLSAGDGNRVGRLLLEGLARRGQGGGA
jgi:UDP-N-acetylmuramate--alanine ligase